MDRKPTSLPTGTLVSAELDDGFGSAVAVHSGDVWVGAPHGVEGRLYRWSAEAIEMAQSGPGRLGAHLSSTGTSLLVSAPLANQVLDHEGQEVYSGRPSMGIALSDGGDAAWERGWRSADGIEGSTPSRPSAMIRDGDQVAVGMAHGPVAFAIDDQLMDRPESGDEAGFSLDSGTVDGQQAWLIGAPAANRVIAVSKADLRELREWKGTGRFGHAMTTTDVNGDGTLDLVVGAPFSGEQGQVLWFSGMETAPQTIRIDAPDARGVGMAITADSSRLIIGAPGSPMVAGQVLVLPLPH